MAVDERRVLDVRIVDRAGEGRLEVLHEDDEMAVVFKPPGVHSAAWAGTRRNWGELTLCDALPLLLTPSSTPSGAASDGGSPSPLPACRRCSMVRPKTSGYRVWGDRSFSG